MRKPILIFKQFQVHTCYSTQCQCSAGIIRKAAPSNIDYQDAESRKVRVLIKILPHLVEFLAGMWPWSPSKTKTKSKIS